MGKEEQTEELDVLASIFPDEITTVSETEFRVAIQLDVGPDDDEEHKNDPTIVLHVQYPETYPEVGPDLDITKLANTPKHDHLDVLTDKAALLDSLAPVIDESLGMAMIFTLVTTLKESAEQLIKERQQAIEAEHDAAIARAEADENRKFEGTKVTREAFLEWSRNFKLEMQADEERRTAELEEELRKKKAGKEEHKMTGKELWEKGLAGKTIDEDDEADALADSLAYSKLADATPQAS